MVIIGFCGFQGSGKDTAANILIQDYNFVKVSFSSKLKDMLAILFSWDRAMLEGDTTESRLQREVVDEWWSQKLNIPKFTPRYALQYFGTDLFRNQFNENIWLLAVEKQLSAMLQNQNIVITDCRFPNEFELIKKYGGKIIYIQRNEPLWFNSYKFDLHCKLNDTDKEQIKNLHPSEKNWIKEKFNLTINNNGSLDDFAKNVKYIFSNF